MFKKNVFFCKNEYHNAVNHEPNFHLFARSSSFLGALFPSLLWSNFYGVTDGRANDHRDLTTDGRAHEQSETNELPLRLNRRH